MFSGLMFYMGNCVSIPVKTINIGSGNVDPARILEYVGEKDHLNTKHQTVIMTEEQKQRERLNYNLEKVDKLIRFNILKDVNVDFQKFKEYSPEKKLERLLETDPSSVNFTVDFKQEDKNLHLCSKNLFALNGNIGILSHLLSFECCCNYLTRLPPSIRMLTNLRVLILTKNKLVELPEEIGELQNLRELDLSSNKLEYLPDSFAGLSKLSNLSIGHNSFTKFPDVVGRLDNLKVLNIQDNRIKYVPLSIFKLPFLTTIFHGGNSFQMFQERSCTKVGDLSFRELVGRKIIRNCFDINRNTSILAKKYLLRVKECGFCKGPLFDFYYEITDMHCFDGYYFPVKYKMCIKHYDYHEDRLREMFTFDNNTAPKKLEEYNITSILQLFQINALEDQKIAKINRLLVSKSKKIPLICLSVWNSRHFKNMKNDQLKTFTSFEDTLNVISKSNSY